MVAYLNLIFSPFFENVSIYSSVKSLLTVGIHVYFCQGGSEGVLDIGTEFFEYKYWTFILNLTGDQL